MATMKDVYIRAAQDAQWESDHVSHRPLRGPQAEIIAKIEKFVRSHTGGYMPILLSRQTGKNEIAALCHRRHLWRNQYRRDTRIWIRTAPTYKPQIVNSKKRLRELMLVNNRKRILYPSFEGQKLTTEEGYIWRVGNASIEFLSSGPHSNVVGGTASECLDMDEAHKINKDKFDEDFAPFTANTNAGTLLWGVAGDGMDTLQWYTDANTSEGRQDLNIFYPCDIWMEVSPAYAAHVNDRVLKLGWDHPIIKTQYRLIPVAKEGLFLNAKQTMSILSGQHERQKSPRPGRVYHGLMDVAAGNEEFNPDNFMEAEEDTDTDSTLFWIYEVTDEIAANGMYPIIHLVDMVWLTGVDLTHSEDMAKQLIEHWGIEKFTVDSIGVGRQIGESLEAYYGAYIINKYHASATTVSEDCFDLLARVNFNSVLMWQFDESDEWKEFERQLGWTKYASKEGKMKLVKPGAKKHIDMTKALTYINQNSPVAGMQELLSLPSDHSS